MNTLAMVMGSEIHSSSFSETSSARYVASFAEPAERDRRVRELLDIVGLGARANHRPHEMSGGEQQRVAIARAFVNRPLILLADEPTGNLDYTTGLELLDKLWRSCNERGQTVVLVTHDAKAAAYADRVCVVQDGRILEEIPLGRREDHAAGPLIGRLAQLGL